MRNIKLFEREINLIIDEDLRMAVKSYMDEETPNYFWTDGASSSGKYHPLSLRVLAVWFATLRRL